MLLLAIALLVEPDSARTLRIPVAPAESLSVVVAGRGDPVVMIPGLFGSAFGFRTLAPLLAASGHRAIVIEPLGIGWSSRPATADYSLTAQARRIAAVLDTLGVTQAIVIAHSVGGSEAFRLAYRRPDLVAGLVSLEGGPTETAVTAAFKSAMRFAPLIKVLGGIRLIRLQVHRMLVASSGDPGWVTDSVVYGYTAGAAADLGATLAAFRGMAQAPEPDRLAVHLHKIRGPVRLLVGGAPHEGDVDRAEVALLQRVLPDFAVDTVPGAGHFLHEEQPAAVFAAVQRIKGNLTHRVHPCCEPAGDGRRPPPP